MLVLLLLLLLDTCRNGLQSVEYNINLCYVMKWSQRIVAMLTRLVERFDPDEFRIREDGING